MKGEYPMKYFYNGREIEVDRVIGNFDHEIDIEGVYYADTGEEITDDKAIDTILNDYYGEFEQQWLELQIDRAVDYYDRLAEGE